MYISIKHTKAKMFSSNTFQRPKKHSSTVVFRFAVENKFLQEKHGKNKKHHKNKSKKKRVKK
jgi:hypothetical protein